MFGKKKRKNIFDEYRFEFHNYINSETKKSEYDEYARLYSEINEYYRNKINAKEIDIKIERIQLEDNLGKYLGELPKFGANYIIALTCALLPMYLQVAGLFDPKTNKLLTALIVIGLIVFGVRSMAKSIDKDKPKDVIYNISLKVLDDIEKELKVESEKAYREAAISYTLEQHSKTNLLNDIILPSIIEVAASSMVKRDGILRKIFRKQKG